MSLKLQEREGKFAVHMGALVQEMKQGVRDVTHQVGHKLGGHKDCAQNDDAVVGPNGTSVTDAVSVVKKESAAADMGAVGMSGTCRWLCNMGKHHASTML